MRQRDAHAICGKGFIRHRAVLLAKPQTYMNRSGLAVAPLVQCYLQSGEQAVIIHDDLDLPLGTIRVKQRGGDARHLGVRSVIECLGSEEFVRVRTGIGRSPCKADTVDYVLSPFTADEAEAYSETLAQAVMWVETLLASVESSCE